MDKNPKDGDNDDRSANYLGLGFLIGAGSGAVLGVLLKNPAVWIGVGAGLGLIVGAVLSQRPR